MSTVSIRPVRTWREQRQFLSLPWRLYRSDPNWVPPLRGNQRDLAGFGRHPFYQDAEGQTFVAYRGREPCGRIAAIVNHAHNRRHEERRGFFGFFESDDDPAVAAGLLDAARGWLAERGMTHLRGPVNPSLNYECGLLVEGFDGPPTFMMTYNPPYYERLLTDAGCEKTQDLYAFWGDTSMLAGLDKKIHTIAELARERFHVQIRRLDPRRFLPDVLAFLDIYNKSLVGTWGFVPLSDAEAKHMAADLRYLLVPGMTALAEVDGRPVGAVFGMLDYNPLIKRIDGRLFPFGFLRLLYQRRQLRRVRLISTNVLPEYQAWGLSLVLLNSLLADGLDWGLTEVEYSWVLESNHFSRASLERGGAKRTHTYRLYDRAV